MGDQNWPCKKFSMQEEQILHINVLFGAIV